MTREEKVVEINRLMDLGLSAKLIATKWGVSYSTVRNLLADPDGSKQKERRERYRRPCPLCGKKMDGSGGFKARRRYCSDCMHQLARNKPMQHGTRNAYARGCRCRACRDASATLMRDYYERNGPSPNKKKKPPEVEKAHRLVGKAIKNGSIIVPIRCAKCGALERGRKGKHAGGRWLHAHHTDYFQPLDVIFVCPPCHKAIHKAERAEAMSSSAHVYTTPQWT